VDIRYWPLKLNICVRGGRQGREKREEATSGVNSLAQFPAARIFSNLIASGHSGVQSGSLKCLTIYGYIKNISVIISVTL
jgi:hypothetical protein